LIKHSQCFRSEVFTAEISVGGLLHDTEFHPYAGIDMCHNIKYDCYRAAVC